MKSIIKELKVTYKTRRKGKELVLITSPRSAWELAITVLKGVTQENFLILALNNKNAVHGYFTVSIGTVNEAIVHPREVFKAAILCNASSIILIHNHPSGITTPSTEDIKTTKRMVEAGELLGIKVLDHVIVTDDSYLSLKDGGYI